MKKNIGVLDRTVRILLAVVIIVLFFTKQISGTAAVILGIIAVVFLLTGVIGFCALYVPFGIKTTKKTGPTPAP